VDSSEDENNNTVEVNEDGSKKVTHNDGSYDVTDKDGTITKFDKDGKKTTVIKGDLTTTFDGDKTTTKNKAGEIVEETEVQDDKEIKTTYERKDGKTIKRQSTDDKLDFITVSEQKDGHTYDTKFNTEEDMKNNKPSEVIKDAQNETQKTVTTYEYLDDGNVKITTTDSSGKQTVEYQNDKGDKIDNPNPEKTYVVQKGQGITAIVKELLKQQGIENPTKEELKKAKEEFLELNKDLVKTYNGPKTEWKGNKYFYVNDKVKVPDFKKSDKATKPEETSSENLTKQQEEALKLLKEQHQQELAKKIDEIKKILGEAYQVEEKDGKLVVKNKDGEVLEEITKMINDERSDKDDIAQILESDKNNNKTLEFDEFKTFIEKQLKEINFEITDANRAKVEQIIKKHFDDIDISEKDNSLTKAELDAKAKEVIQKLADELIKIDDEKTEETAAKTTSEAKAKTTATKTKAAAIRYTDVKLENIQFSKPLEYISADPNKTIDIEGSYAEPPKNAVRVKITVPADSSDEHIRNELAKKIKETDIQESK